MGEETSSEFSEESIKEEESSNGEELTEGEESSEADKDEEISEELPSMYDGPLYTGAKLTVIESYVKIMKYALRHSLTKQALGDLLTLVDDHLPTCSIVSLYRLRKLFLQLYEDISFTRHYCCVICHSPLESPSSSCRHRCGADSTIEFLQIDIQPQLRRRFQGNCVCVCVCVFVCVCVCVCVIYS